MESKLWIRHRGSASAAEQTLRVAVAREDSDVTVTVHRAEDDVAMVRIASWAASALGMLALVVAAIALYGVAAFAVNRRLREIGIRMALGASTGDLLRLVCGQLPGPVGLGLLVGISAAIAIGHLIRSMLYGISPFDPVALGAVVAVLALAALAASWIPARRAARVDPALVLRND